MSALSRTLSSLVCSLTIAAIAFEAPTNYLLGPDDQITIQALDAEEISGKPARVDMRGYVNLPMAGRILAAGLTIDQLELEVKKRLKKFLQDPEVVISITAFRAQPISILGAVASPGIHQLQGSKNLFSALSLAGGLRADAGYQVKITRRLEWGRIPLPNAADDPTGRFSVASVSTKSIMAATNPVENIDVKPDDVISVPKGDLIYVIGAVRKSGGFMLGESETLSALQALALAEGLDRFAAPQSAKIMRAVPGNASRTEIPLNLKLMMAGKVGDAPLKAEDILFIPDSAKKSAAVRGIEAALGMGASIGTGLVIYRR